MAQTSLVSAVKLAIKNTKNKSVTKKSKRFYEEHNGKLCSFSVFTHVCCGTELREGDIMLCQNSDKEIRRVYSYTGGIQGATHIIEFADGTRIFVFESVLYKVRRKHRI